MKLFPISPRMRQLAPLALVLLSAAAAVAAYLQALGYPFLSDDEIYITNNPKLTGLQLAELWRLFTEPYNKFEFLPLRDFSYWFDIMLFGPNPSAFRMHSILLYLLCLPLVYGVTLGIWRHFRPADAASAPWAAAAVTALFALHPAHVEAVVWISGRKDVLAAMFSLLALWLAVSARREQGFSSPYAVAALVALLAALLSKATAVAVAPVIALLWVIFWCDIPAQKRRRSLLQWPLGSLLLAACVALFFAANSTVKAPAYFGVEIITRALAVLGWLTRLAISPENRHFIYRVFEDPYLPAMVVLGVAILAVAVVSMVMILRQRSLERFALVVFFLLCMPYTQLIPFNTVSLVADRFLTLALWPVVLLMVALSWRLNPVARTVLLLVIALPWGFQTVERPRDWRNQEALTDTDLRAYPGYYVLAREKVIGQLQQGLTREAMETANNITVPEMRNIMVKLVEAANAVNEAKKIGDPRDAMARLQNLGLLLERPPVQIKWNPSMFYFWESCQNAFALNWKWLVMDFPNDVSLRDNSRLSLMGIMKHKTYATY